MESKLLVVPSTTHIEGSPLVIAESIFCGTPVIVSNQPAMIDAMGKAGDYFQTGNEESLYECLVRNLYDSEQLERITTFCTVESMRFSFKKYNDDLNHILKSLELQRGKKKN